MHNGIEYAVMQLIAEAVDLLRQDGLDGAELAAVVEQWAAGDCGSYLLDITAALLKARDPLTDGLLLDVIDDRAEQKGTGQWAAVTALELGVAAPSLAEAVSARHLAAAQAERQSAAQCLSGPQAILGLEPAQVGAALEAATLAVYAQGFAVIAAAAQAEGWDTNLAQVAGLWRAGCIIRSRLLPAMTEALNRNALALSPWAAEFWATRQTGWRQTMTAAIQDGTACPVMASALSWYDGLRKARGSGVLIQAQRDYFGRHGLRRTDRDGLFHWDGLP